MNAIDTLITLADVRGSLDLRCQFQGDWALNHDQMADGIAPYHIVLAGECRVELPDGRRLTLLAGDILVLPSGIAHLLLSRGERVPASSPQLQTGGLLTVQRFGDGAELDLLCGQFVFQREAMLFSALMACGLLTRSQNGLSDIAAEVGYQSQAAFSKVFKETYGMAPGQMRRQLTKDAPAL